MCQPQAQPLMAHRVMRRSIIHPQTQELLDDALAVYFPHGRSFTGQATLELHLHGSPAVVRDVLEALDAMRTVLSTRDMRPALPGEFTRRAFEHGRLDLTACEALDSLLHAETSQQRRLAQWAAQGYQAQLYDRLYAQLVQAMSQMEAMLDFSDEDDVNEHLWISVHETIHGMRQYLASELQLNTPPTRRSYADAVMQGVRIALYGRPNAGKSSLLNRLVRRDAAIVTPYAGTTRDVLEVCMELAGYRVTLADTAGVRASQDAVEQIGIERTQAYVAEADMCVLVCTPQDFQHDLPPAGPCRIPAATLERLGVQMQAKPVLILINKMDECWDVGGDHTSSPPSKGRCDHEGVECHVWHASVLHDVGMDLLMNELGSHVARMYDTNQVTMPLVTQARHRHILMDVVACLDTVLATRESPDLVVVAEELRHAAHLLAQVTGRTITSDTVLGEIFARFCIGK
mgnify:FL=1